MPSSLNKVMLLGNLGKDAETRHTQTGTAVTQFSLATTARFKDRNSGEWREKTDWHDVVLWRGEGVTPYLRKGKKVFVEGRLQTRSWEDQSGQKRYRTEVICDPGGLVLLGGREGGSSESFRGSGSGGFSRGPEGSMSGGRPSSSGSSKPSGGDILDDDNIPF